MTFTKLPKAITAEELLSTAAGQVDHSRSAPCRIGAVCRSQQGRQKLADAVALLTDCAGQSCLESRNRAMHRDLFLVGRYI